MARKNRNEMSFIEHLEDLRWHIIRTLVVIVACSVFFLIRPDIIFDKVILGPKDLNFPTYQVMCALGERLSLNGLCIDELNYDLFYLNISSPFFLYLKIAIMGGAIFAFPYILWEIWRFVRPGLHLHEKRNLGGLVFVATLLFYIGCFFGYFLLAPFSINFLANFELSDQVKNQFTFDSYLGILTGMVLWTGVIFEIPMIAYFLARMGLLTNKFMMQQRKFAFVASLVLAAVITPSGDAFSLFLVATPLWALYEVSIIVVRRVEKRMAKEEGSDASPA
ncbi:MAG: twin-arginine translocase subunit TatC [Chitinophagales bacterium]|nr:twin-arginine translocase subunit TatC [Chitinophagales bacterium]HAE13559.1 twin-arginine translocase subunit TatC [Bacteroidota bacterium]MCB9018758.1 twin-arginine translocase subunit TatC [Chitinophagales bacterium]MCB9020950.1 twin-arginine translocase subunit TatC [Chitinophagales bacterium]MCB9031843.1 twin-arginine translocase subunit TatC [Chitinophagales bacterium]